MRGAGNEAVQLSRHALPIALAMVGITTARAADTSGADANGKQRQIQDASLRDFMRANPDCLEFTKCSHCAVVDGAAECSTVEMACIKRESQCTKRASP